MKPLQTLAAVFPAPAYSSSLHEWGRICKSLYKADSVKVEPNWWGKVGCWVNVTRPLTETPMQHCMQLFIIEALF